MAERKGPELIPVREVRVRLGISRVTMARLLKEGRFTIYLNPLDRREKLIDVAEMEEARRPRPAAEGMGKAAA